LGKKSIVFLELEAFISLQLKLVNGSKGCHESWEVMKIMVNELSIIIYEYYKN